MIDLLEPELVDFYIEAKLHTYAGGRAKPERLADGWKRFVWPKKPSKYRYEDRYLVSPDGTTFAGVERLTVNEKAYLVMCYNGNWDYERIPAEKGFAFLRCALRAVPHDLPFRGPQDFSQGSLNYMIDDIVEDSRVLRAEELIIHTDRDDLHNAYSGFFIAALIGEP